jgi:hypothetical protein
MTEPIGINEVQSSRKPESPIVSVEVELIPELDAVYANHVLLLGTPHDMTLDFYAITPLPPDRAQAKHVARTRLPLSLLKGLRDALISQIARVEETQGRELPNLRTLDLEVRQNDK